MVVMEASQLDILAAHGVPRERLVLLPRFAPARVAGTGYRRDNIEDPFGQPLPAFERCYAQTAAAVDGLVARLHDAARSGASHRSNVSERGRPASGRRGSVRHNGRLSSVMPRDPDDRRRR